MSNATNFFIVFSALQVVLVGLAAWSLSTTVRLLNRVTALETTLESHIAAQMKDLRERMNRIENQTQNRT